MRRIISIALWASLAAACDIPPEVRLEIACTTVCDCLAGPVDAERCTTECIEDGDLALIPDECFECIQTHANACSTLIADCDPVCDQPQPDPPPDLPDGGMP